MVPAAPMLGPLPSRLLRLLRDRGALSRAELADRLNEPRARLLAEIDVLVSGGLVREAGPAASRGGRRSTRHDGGRRRSGPGRRRRRRK